MQHSEEHEHRILAYILGDSSPPLAKREVLEQLFRCDTCIGFGYRALAELPLLVESSGAHGAPAADAAERAATRLELLLSDAVEHSDTRSVTTAHADRPQRHTGWGRWLHWDAFRPALGLAFAAGLTIVVAVAGLQSQDRRAERAFLANQAERVMGAFPARYSFSQAPRPAPYWRGYASSLVANRQADTAGPATLQAVQETLALGLSGSVRHALELADEDERCKLLTSNPKEQLECALGAHGFRLRHQLQLAHPESTGKALRSTETMALLQWVGGETSRSRTTPALRRLAAELEDRTENGLQPDAAEMIQWTRLVEGLLRDD